MNRSKFVAILTGAIAILLSIVYLVIVQLLDFRGEMVPAPVGFIPASLQVIVPTVEPAVLPPGSRGL